MTKRYGAFSSTVSIGFLTAWQKGSTSYGLYGRKCRWKSVRTLHVSLYSVVRFSTYLRFSYTGSHYCISEFQEKWKKFCLLCLPGYYANAFRTSTNEAQVINKCTCWNGLAIALRCLIQNDMLVTCDCILHGDAVFSQTICPALMGCCVAYQVKSMSIIIYFVNIKNIFHPVQKKLTRVLR